MTSAPPHSDTHPVDLESFDDDEMTRVVEGGALAGAFAAAVIRDPSVPRGAVRSDMPQAGGAAVSAGTRESQPTRDSLPITADEWFVGVNGVPVGPLRLSELRSRALSGAIGTDNLVWREGFEEWLPLHKFPELVAIVEEGLSAARASAAPLAVPREHADPFARDEKSAASPAAAPVVAPAPAAAPESLPTRPSVVLDDVAPPVRRGGISPAALFAMVVAVGLGLALGFVVFGGEKTKIVREVVEVPTERAEEAAPPPPSAVAEVEAAPADSTAQKSSPGTSSRTASGKPAPAPAASQQGLTGLSGLKGLGSGPQGGPSTGSVSSGSSQPLDSSQVQATVGRYTSSVKRSCWQPALDTRDKDAPTSARVTVNITVGPDGKVRQATTSGDPRGYSGLASCISRRVQTWTFPPSSGTTTVNVPFVFAAQ